MYVVEPLAVTDTNLLASNLSETGGYGAWNSGATYALADRVIRDHAIWQSVQGSNLNHDPSLDDGTWWVRVQATNRWRAFDGVISDPATRTGNITYQLRFDRTIDSIVFFALDATDIDITITDPVDGVIYDATYSLVSGAGEVIDAWTYFFDPITAQTTLTAEWLPGWAGCTIDISINSSGTTTVGEIFFGSREHLGETLVDTEVGFRDYSIKSRDEFGNAFVVPRDFTKIVNYKFSFPTYDIDRIVRLLTRLRATPAVYTGGAETDQYSLAVAGFFQDFTVPLTTTLSFGSLEIESLV